MTTRIFKLIRREFLVLFKDKRLFFIVLCMPMLYISVFGFLYIQKRVRYVPTYFIDQDHSALSRAIRNSVASSETFKIVRDDATEADFRKATQLDKAFACIIVPKGFEADVKHGRSAKIMTLIDGSNLLVSNTIRGGIAEIGGTFSVGVQMKRLAMRGTPGEHALPASIPVEAVTRIWYNPTFSYASFVLLGLAGAVVQQINLLGVALSFSREREKKLLANVLKISNSVFEILLGKMILYTFFALLTSFATFYVVTKYFGLNNNGEIFLVSLIIALFAVSVVALGILISSVCKDQLFATEVLMLLSLPSFLLSGFTWPQFAMPKGILIISQYLPLTHLVLPLRAVFIQGAGYAEVRSHIIWLWCLAGGSLLLAYLVMWQALSAARKQVERE